jgi:hypothetical protein
MRTGGQTGGRTDKQDEAYSHFSQFCGSAKNAAKFVSKKNCLRTKVCDGVISVFGSSEEGQKEATHPD